MTVSKSKQKMSQSPNVGSVTPTLRAKDSRAMKLGVPPRTLWSNDQDPVMLVGHPSATVTNQDGQYILHVYIKKGG